MPLKPPPAQRITQKMEITLNHDVDIHVRLHMSPSARVAVICRCYLIKW